MSSDRLTHRFTTALAHPAHQAMTDEMTATGATQNEVINRALLLLRTIRSAQRDGSIIYLQPPDGSAPHRILIM